MRACCCLPSLKSQQQDKQKTTTLEKLAPLATHCLSLRVSARHALPLRATAKRTGDLKRKKANTKHPNGPLCIETASVSCFLAGCARGVPHPPPASAHRGGRRTQASGRTAAKPSKNRLTGRTRAQSYIDDGYHIDEVLFLTPRGTTCGHRLSFRPFRPPGAARLGLSLPWSPPHCGRCLPRRPGSESRCV